MTSPDYYNPRFYIDVEMRRLSTPSPSILDSLDTPPTSCFERTSKRPQPAAEPQESFEQKVLRKLDDLEEDLEEITKRVESIKKKVDVIDERVDSNGWKLHVLVSGQNEQESRQKL